MYFEHVVSCRFGIQTALGPYASLLSLLQTALAHEATVCVTWRAVAQHIFLSMSRLLNTYMFYQHSGHVVPANTVSNVVWCTLNNGHVGTLRCGLSAVAPSDAKFACCF